MSGNTPRAILALALVAAVIVLAMVAYSRMHRRSADQQILLLKAK